MSHQNLRRGLIKRNQDTNSGFSQYGIIIGTNLNHNGHTVTGNNLVDGARLPHRGRPITSLCTTHRTRLKNRRRHLTRLTTINGLGRIVRLNTPASTNNASNKTVSTNIITGTRTVFGRRVTQLVRFFPTLNNKRGTGPLNPGRHTTISNTINPGLTAFISDTINIRGDTVTGICPQVGRGIKVSTRVVTRTCTDLSRRVNPSKTVLTMNYQKISCYQKIGTQYQAMKLVRRHGNTNGNRAQVNNTGPNSTTFTNLNLRNFISKRGRNTNPNNYGGLNRFIPFSMTRNTYGNLVCNNCPNGVKVITKINLRTNNNNGPGLFNSNTRLREGWRKEVEE